MNIESHNKFLVRLAKFDDYKGPICLNASNKEGCNFCPSDCKGLSSRVIIDALSLDKKNLYFEEEDAFYQATNIFVKNNNVRGNYDKYSIIFKYEKNIGRIRADLLMKIRDNFIKLAEEIENIDDPSFAESFCNKWEFNLSHLKYVTEFEEERLRTEEALNNANEILSANNIIIRYLIDGTITFVNPFAEMFFKFEADDLLGKNIIGTILPENNLKGIPYKDRLNLFADNPQVFKFRQLKNIRKDGAEKWVAWTNKPLFDSKGNFNEILSVGMDITPLKETERKLAEEKTLAQLYFDLAGVMLVVLDMDLKISKINQKGCQLMGYDENELIGKDWCSDFFSEKEKKSMCDILEGVKIGKNEHNRTAIIDKDGKKKIVFWHISPIKNENGEVTGIICSGEDITEQKDTEKKIIKAKAIKTLKDQIM